MNHEPVFKLGQRVQATGPYMWSLTEGREYIVLAYEDPVVTPTFTFPAYVTVMGDLGKLVTGHTYRFRAIPEDSQT